MSEKWENRRLNARKIFACLGLIIFVLLCGMKKKLWYFYFVRKKENDYMLPSFIRDIFNVCLSHHLLFCIYYGMMMLRTLFLTTPRCGILTMSVELVKLLSSLACWRFTSKNVWTRTPNKHLDIFSSHFSNCSFFFIIFVLIHFSFSLFLFILFREVKSDKNCFPFDIMLMLSSFC